jgi:hypothetical protein
MWHYIGFYWILVCVVLTQESHHASADGQSANMPQFKQPRYLHDAFHVGQWCGRRIPSEKVFGLESADLPHKGCLELSSGCARWKDFNEGAR